MAPLSKEQKVIKQALELLTGAVQGFGTLSAEVCNALLDVETDNPQALVYLNDLLAKLDEQCTVEMREALANTPFKEEVGALISEHGDEVLQIGAALLFALECSEDESWYRGVLSTLVDFFKEKAVPWTIAYKARNTNKGDTDAAMGDEHNDLEQRYETLAQRVARLEELFEELSVSVKEGNESALLTLSVLRAASGTKAPEADARRQGPGSSV